MSSRSPPAVSRQRSHSAASTTSSGSDGQILERFDKVMSSLGRTAAAMAQVAKPAVCDSRAALAKLKQKPPPLLLPASRRPKGKPNLKRRAPLSTELVSSSDEEHGGTTDGATAHQPKPKPGPRHRTKAAKRCDSAPPVLEDRDGSTGPIVMAPLSDSDDSVTVLG